MKYLIQAPSYDENNGGVIVLHKLCSIINTLGYECYLIPPHNRYYEISKSSPHNSIKAILGFMRRVATGLYQEHQAYKHYKTNPSFNTPLFNQKNALFDDDWIIIYPEIVVGNPLQAKNVVRWLLYKPGALGHKKIYFGQNELYFKFSSGMPSFCMTGSTLSKHILKINHTPTEYYNMDNIADNRAGTAYCMRKQKNKSIQHDLKDSILIDGKSHAEIAAIFKRVKTFISYDTLTGYSKLAVLCGCDSIIIPDEEVPEDKWYPDPKDRHGLAYGFENIEKARNTVPLLKQRVKEEEGTSIANTKKFILECTQFFNVTRKTK